MRRSSRSPKLLVGPARSGTNAFIYAMSLNPEVIALGQLIKAGMRDSGIPDYSVFKRVAPAGKTIVDKETIGFETVETCTMEVFPDDRTMVQSEPLFLFRDPVHCWNSWAKRNWGSLELFTIAYRHTANLFARAKKLGCGRPVIYEDLAAHPSRHFSLICDYWGIAFSPTMVAWGKQFDPGTVIWAKEFRQSLVEGNFDSLVESSSFGCKPIELIISDSDINIISSELMDLYEDLHIEARSAWL